MVRGIFYEKKLIPQTSNVFKLGLEHFLLFLNFTVVYASLVERVVVLGCHWFQWNGKISGWLNKDAYIQRLTLTRFMQQMQILQPANGVLQTA